MPVAAPQEGYSKMIAYGQKKSMLRMDQLALQSFLAGFWVALFGHCCTTFASSFFIPELPLYAGMTRIAYGVLFPGAFIAVIYTGTELFTGNTVTMMMLVFHEGRSALKHLVRVWGFSLVGNFAGATFGAFFFSYLSGVFHVGRPRDYLFYLADQKTSRYFDANIILGVGCNSLVCLATWCVVVSDDGAGKILAMFYSIGVFSMGGLEHVIANFYTLTAAAMCGYTKHSFWEIMWRNWLPVLIGNLIAGTLFTGMLWWYALHPALTELAPFSNQELERELTRRYGAPDELWARGSKTMTSLTFSAHQQSMLGIPPQSPSIIATQQQQPQTAI